MSRAASHPLIGTWRIVEADLWDRDYLDLVEPARISFGKGGRGAFAFGAVHGDMDPEYSPGAVSFTWAGFDEMDDVSGAGRRTRRRRRPRNRTVLPSRRRRRPQSPPSVTSSTAC
jgi:hypothetical protein